MGNDIRGWPRSTLSVARHCVSAYRYCGGPSRALFYRRGKESRNPEAESRRKTPLSSCVSFPFGAHQLRGARVFLEGASIDVAPPRYDASRLGLALGGPRWQWQRRVKIRRDGYRRKACTLVDLSATPRASPTAFPSIAADLSIREAEYGLCARS